MIDFNRGNGKIFYFTSLLNLDWNDLTLRGLLIPLMYRLLILGGTDEVNSLPVMVGDTKWINLKENEVRNEWEVQSPSGIKNLIVPDFSKESLKITDTNEHGIYSVFKNKKLYTSLFTSGTSRPSPRTSRPSSMTSRPSSRTSRPSSRTSRPSSRT